MTQVTCAVFDKATGEIRFIYTGPEEDLSDYVSEGFGSIECDENVADYSHWVSQTKSGAEIKERDPLDVSHTADGMLLTFGSLPPGTTVEIEDLSITTDVETTEIEFDIPGTYLIQFRPPAQFLDSELEVTVG